MPLNSQTDIMLHKEAKLRLQQLQHNSHVNRRTHTHKEIRKLSCCRGRQFVASLSSSACSAAFSFSEIQKFRHILSMIIEIEISLSFILSLFLLSIILNWGNRFFFFFYIFESIVVLFSNSPQLPLHTVNLKLQRSAAGKQTKATTTKAIYEQRLPLNKPQRQQIDTMEHGGNKQADGRDRAGPTSI